MLTAFLYVAGGVISMTLIDSVPRETRPSTKVVWTVLWPVLAVLVAAVAISARSASKSESGPLWTAVAFAMTVIVIVVSKIAD